MRGLTAALLISLPLCACAPKAADSPGQAPLALDCTLSFEVQAVRLAAQPRLIPAPKEPGEPYRFYSTDSGAASYVITEQGAPGHPAILMQTAGGGQVKTTGCPYGDLKGYKQVRAYIDSLKAAARR